MHTMVVHLTFRQYYYKPKVIKNQPLYRKLGQKNIRTEARINLRHSISAMQRLKGEALIY